MNPKYSILYLLLIPGMIFSLISIFLGFSWIILILSFLIGLIIYSKESGISIRLPTKTSETTVPSETAASNTSILKRIQEIPIKTVKIILIIIIAIIFIWWLLKINNLSG